MRSDPLIFVSAGEASGDHYGAQLIAAVRQVLPQARFTGLGGTEMEAAGQQRVVRAEDVAVMGITEILSHIPTIVRSYFKLVASIKRTRPDVAVLIDFPDVNFRLAKHLHRMGVKVIWFVSPQLWAWKRRRLRWVQQRVWKMLTIFPFEQTFYDSRGVTAEFVGHPLAEMPLPTMRRDEFLARYFHTGPDSSHFDKPWVALLPGSRWKEMKANLPEMLRAAALLGPGHDVVVPIASNLDSAQASNFVFQTLKATPNWPANVSVTLSDDARSTLLHSRAAVVASGTATVQAAVIGTPFVVVYRVSNMTFRLAKRLVRYPEEIPAELDEHGNLPIAMVNLIAGKRVVPEFLQEHFRGEEVAAALRPLIADTPERAKQVAALAEVRARLRSTTNRAGIEHLRDAVLEALQHPVSDDIISPNKSASNR